MPETYDLIVIGGGSAGLTAARFGAQLGLRVALTEVERIGGDCTWTGCIPSKSLVKAAKVAHDIRSANRYGLNAVEPLIDLKAVMDRVKGMSEEVYQGESAETLRNDGIDVFFGPARFLDSGTVRVGDARLKGRRFVIATGARPVTPSIPGLTEVNYLTYETVWELQDLPERLMVIGGGPIGCELGQAFQRLGSKVTLLEAGPRLLPKDESEASDLLLARLVEEGMDVRLGASVQRVWQQGTIIRAETGGEELRGDVMLLAVGRTPRVDDLGLEQAGVGYTARGIEVDTHLRTSRKHIYAAGDCLGGYQFTHYAGWQGFMAVRNAFLPGATKAVLNQAPWATFTDPEVARVGLSEVEARADAKGKVGVATWPLEKIDRALTEGDSQGFLKIVHRTNGTVLGATIVAPRAAEMVQEWALAIDKGLKIGDLANSLHIYPAYSMGNMQAAADIRVKGLLAGISGRLVRALAGGRPPPPSLKNRYRVDRRAGGVVQRQRPNGQHELPAVAFPAGRCQFLKIGVVQNPHSHRHDADLVDGVGQPWVLLGRNVIAGVGAQHCNVPLPEDGQAGGLAGRRSSLPDHRPFDVAAMELSRPNQKDVSRFNLEPAPFLRGQYIVGHNAFAAFQPVDAPYHWHVNQHPAGDYPVPGFLH